MDTLDFIRRAFWMSVIVAVVLISVGCFSPEEQPQPEPEPVVMTCIEPAEVEEEEAEPTETVRYAITDTERTLLEQVVMAESGTEPYCGQVAVAQCILTACEKDGLRPSEVVREYQYSLERPKPSESASDAVRAVFDRGEVAFWDDPLWFYAYKSGYSEFHERQRLIAEVGGHRFFGEWEEM